MNEEKKNEVIGTEKVTAENTTEAVVNVAETAEEPKKSKRQIKKELWKQDKANMKLEKKAKKAAKKAARKEKKLKKKRKYKNAPFLVKLWHKVIKRLIVAVLALSVLAGGSYMFVLSPAGQPILVSIINVLFLDGKNDPVDKEKIYEISAKDEKGDEEINALDKIGEDETWTICYYMVGSNLEDGYTNELSPITVALTQDEKAENSAKSTADFAEQLSQYNSELNSKGIEMPDYMYEPTEYPAASSDESTGEMPAGAASSDIGEILSGEWSDNINIVIQTGGATKWDNSMVNPNKTQRFEYKDGVFREVENMPLQDSCDPNTLADFMKYCDENYPSDHRMLVLWDHGAGAFGYGVDDIYGSTMTLKDIESAFAANYKEDAANPHYDIIGFDACLMGSTEVAHSLYGYGKYLLGSEEVEPGDGWDHGKYLQAMTDDPTMSPAAIGEVIADSFVDYYVTWRVNTNDLIDIDIAFSVIDINAAEDTYNSYCELNGTLLKDAVKDMSVLSKVGAAADNSTRFAETAYRVCNTIDLGNYMDALSEYYPDECQKVLDNLDRAVLYHRESGYLSDAEGISVYMPVYVRGAGGMQYFLKYINTICDDDATNALYYYKIAGCLNDEYQSFATDKGYGTADVINTAELKKFAQNEITLGENDFSIALTDGQKTNAQKANIELGKYNVDDDTITYYGESVAASINDNTVETNFDGKWITLNGQPLYTEIVSETDSTVTYRSPVKINYNDCYLFISYDKTTGEASIKGATKLTDESDASSAYVSAKQNEELKGGDQIIPVYDLYDFNDDSTTKTEGDIVIYGKLTSVKLDSVSDGKYLNAVVLTDIRGDKYYSGVVEQTISGGTVSDQFVSTEFVGSSY